MRRIKPVTSPDRLIAIMGAHRLQEMLRDLEHYKRLENRAFASFNQLPSEVSMSLPFKDNSIEMVRLPVWDEQTGTALCQVFQALTEYYTRIRVYLETEIENYKRDNPNALFELNLLDGFEGGEIPE